MSVHPTTIESVFDVLDDPLATAGVGRPDAMDDLEPGALVEVIGSAHRLESMLIARRLAAVAALLRHRAAAVRAETPRSYSAIDGFEQTTAEVAAVMNLSPMAAGVLVSHAQTLDIRLPHVAALLAAGRTDWRTVRLIISRTDLITDYELITTIDQSLAQRIGKWQGWSTRRIINAVDAAVRVADPDAARERREHADNERYIRIGATDNGMAEIHGSVAAAAATAFGRRLSQLAGQVCAADPRTLDQRRADALAALTEGRGLLCGCGKPECPTTTTPTDADRDPAGVQVVINVVASEQTLTANSTQPGYLHGYGVIDAEQVRALAADAWLRMADARTSAAEALRYQPSAALQRMVRCRDLTCRFPGCARPALICDLDHTVPFNHANPAAGGLTVLENLKCLCRLHHRLKTFGGWRDVQQPDGGVEWTSPTGQRYRTAPAGADLFPQLHTPACAAPSSSRRNRTKQRAARINQARKHNHEQRPINEARRQLDQARKAEISARKSRNHIRDMLFLFKGIPSTSPYCTWVNDPREPEELPPDWQPPPPPEALPDDPPF